MSIDEKFAKIKAERHKFYDDLLKKILALPNVQAELEELRKDEDGTGEFEIAEQALENFILEGDEKDILAVPEIWRMIQEAIQDETKWMTYDVKTFLDERSSLNADDIYTKKIEEIHDELYHALKRKHGIEKVEILTL